MHLHRDMRQAFDPGKTLLVGSGRLRMVGDDGQGQAHVPRPEAQKGKVRTLASADLQPLAERSSPHDHRAIRTAPRMPMTGSSQTQPKKRPASNATIASTEVSMSASTC